MENLPAVLGLPWHGMFASGSFDFARSSICSARAYSVRKLLCITFHQRATLKKSCESKLSTVQDGFNGNPLLK